MNKRPTLLSDETRKLLIGYAEKYETRGFLNGDPSWFMHQVKGAENQEVMGFFASCLSYGSRKQFLPKIEWLRTQSEGEPYRWVAEGAFEDALPTDDKACFYRLNTVGDIRKLLHAQRKMLNEYGTMGIFVERNATDAISAISALCRYFAQEGASGIIPHDTTSACKRMCMFLRWMVRDGSPVDIGLWSKHISRKSLIMPLDTHVLRQSLRLGLMQSRTASMSAARKLTSALAEVFPDDPLKGDFALFGYGVNEEKE